MSLYLQKYGLGVQKQLSQTDFLSLANIIGSSLVTTAYIREELEAI